MDLGKLIFTLLFAVTFVVFVNKGIARYRAYVRRRNWIRKARGK